MKKYICKICGFAMNEKIDVGTICPCCFNEYQCDDELTKYEILMSYCDGNLDVLHTIAPELDGVDMKEYVDTEIAWRILRLVWIKKGAKYIYKPRKILSQREVQAQLKNIGYDYEELKKLSRLITCNMELDE